MKARAVPHPLAPGWCWNLISRVVGGVMAFAGRAGGPTHWPSEPCQAYEA